MTAQGNNRGAHGAIPGFILGCMAVAGEYAHHGAVHGKWVHGIVLSQSGSNTLKAWCGHTSR